MISVTRFSIVQLVCLVSFSCFSAVTAQTWHVLPDGSGDAPTIQAGIDSSSAGDTVLVSCGVYFESSIVVKSGILLTSETGDARCVTIDAQGLGRVFDCSDCDSQTEIRGLTVTHGRAPGVEPGGGIRAVGCSMKVAGCSFVANSAVGGGGAYCQGGGPSFTSCGFTSGTAETGAGIQCWQSSPDIVGCLFVADSTQFSGTVFCVYSAPHIASCTFYHNFADGGSGIFCSSFSNAVVERTIFAFGRAFAPVGFELGSNISLSCCDIFGNEFGDWVGSIADQLGVNGNFSADPLFCDTTNRDLRLQDCSPCVPGQREGSDCEEIVGAFPVGCDCEEATEPTTWGAIKAMYR